jgi:hypothetical protein
MAQTMSDSKSLSLDVQFIFNNTDIGTPEGRARIEKYCNEQLSPNYTAECTEETQTLVDIKHKNYVAIKLISKSGDKSSILILSDEPNNAIKVKVYPTLELVTIFSDEQKVKIVPIED